MDQLDQAKKLINGAQNILILLPGNYIQGITHPGRAGDLFCGGSALSFALKKVERNVKAAIKEVPSKFQFLNCQPEINLNNCTISVNAAGKEISELRYEKNGEDLKIHLAFKTGEIKENDVVFTPSLVKPVQEEKPDLLITIGASSLEDLEDVFEDSPEFFYETAILNIDKDPANENFGEVNLIDITTASVSEIITDLIKSSDQSLFDEEITTILLAGIISASQNFQSPKIPPKTFETASFLLEKGARHQEIIQKLFRQKSISQIRLFGRVLEKLEFDKEKELYLVSLKKKDFQDLGAKDKDIGLVLEDLRSTLYNFSSLLLLWESHASPPAVRGVFYSPRPDLINRILENFEGKSRGKASLFLIREADINIAKEKLLNILEK